MLKARCYRLAPLLFGGSHILVIFAQIYASETVFFPAPNAKFSLPWEGIPLPDLPPARSLRSLAVLLAGYFRRAIETSKYINFQRRSLANHYDECI